MLLILLAIRNLFCVAKKLKQINIQNETNQGHKVIKFLNRVAKTAILSSTASGFEGFGGQPLPKVSLLVSLPPPRPPLRGSRKFFRLKARKTCQGACNERHLVRFQQEHALTRQLNSLLLIN